MPLKLSRDPILRLALSVCGHPSRFDDKKIINNGDLIMISTL